MTDPTTTPAPLPDELQRLLNAASALVQGAHTASAIHVIIEPERLAALREALGPARAAAEGLARERDMFRGVADEMGRSSAALRAVYDTLETRAARWKRIARRFRREWRQWGGAAQERIQGLQAELAAARHEAAQQARAAQMWRDSQRAASIAAAGHQEDSAIEIARLRAERDAAQARADRLADERREGIAREASLALTVERLVGDLWAAEVVLDGHGFKAAADDLRARREAITTTPAPDAAPAALLQAMRAVISWSNETSQVTRQPEIALLRAAAALRAAGEGE